MPRQITKGWRVEYDLGRAYMGTSHPVSPSTQLRQSIITQDATRDPHSLPAIQTPAAIARRVSAPGTAWIIPKAPLLPELVVPI